MTTWHFILNAE